jgi:hypothetical protein
MSLTATDFQEIRNILKDELTNELTPVKGELMALRNDIKEIYAMISGLEHSTITDKNFKKLSLEQKVLTLNADLVNVAKQAGISLPR